MPQTISLPDLDDFLLSLKANNYSSETVENYERDLLTFQLFLQNDVRCQFSDITKKTIEQYKAYLTSRDRQTKNQPNNKSKKQPVAKKLASHSINRMLSALRSYLRYLERMDDTPPLSALAVTLIKTEHKQIKIGELETVIKLIESPSSLEADQAIRLRNRAMLETLFATGMRISELLGLNREHIDGSGRIFIMGKGKKERFVYLTPRATQHLNAYLLARSDTDPALFIPYRGGRVSKQKSAKRISHNYLQMKLKQYREQLQINIPMSPHKLRHAFATYLAESGANPAAIQILLGHESLETTTRYVNASQKYAEQSHHKYHPLKN